jgi:alkanesulfonate monooxygenase SsuD/methylene tetrahydromethanopterin reductase-like flavin-dependent oxidoreductase (luciferase family)
VAPNVLNLPLRQPAVVARAAASLDLLSGGRVELGLGAGAFWDAITAMGGEKLSPGQAVDALSEAIDVIRQLWDVSTRRGARVEGEHHRVVGAKRGPEPAHDIGIWLGAYKPRMLRLTGRKADGWLPSQAYLPVEDIPQANATIDAAAAQAGRDPREIRRLLNVGADPTVEELLPLALEHGFSTFILAGDDPRAIERFGSETAPGLRAAVAEARNASGIVTGEVVRGPKALAARREGIDYDAVPEPLRERAVEPGDKTYAKVRSTYIRSGSPGLVLRPRDADEVVSALRYARAQDVPLSVRSGGHGISGRSTNEGGIIIDLGALNAIEVLDGTRIRLGPGARWGHVAQELARHGLAMSSGDYGDVGVGGLATTGGIGFLARKHGLTIDHVVGAEVVLADGSVVQAGDDLLWALRGAGGNFGIVTAFELDAYPLRNVVFSTMAFAGDAALLERWGELIEAAPRELTSFLIMGRQRGIPVVQLYSVFASDDTEAAVDALTPLLEIGPLLEQQAQLVPYAAIVPPHGGVHMGGYEPVMRSGLLDHITAQAAEAMVALGSPFLQIRSVGGAVNDVDPLATAYAHRTQNFSVAAVAAHDWDALMGSHVNGLYLSFDTDQRPERLREAFPEPTLTRLRELKATYDPDNVFNQNFPIPPAARVAEAVGPMR